MSFWGRLGSLGKDLGETLVSTPKFAWDMASGLWRDEEQYNGFVNTFKTAGKQWAQTNIETLSNVASLPGVKQALETIDRTNQTYIREPLTALALMDSDFNDIWQNEDGTRASLGEAWTRAKARAEYTSLGQALYGTLATSNYASDETKNKWADFDWENNQMVDEYFSKGWQKYASGFIDATAQVFGDVTIVGGKATKIARGASWASNTLNKPDKIKNVISAVRAAEDGLETNKFTTFLDTLAKNDAVFISNLPEMKDAPQTLVYALGNATDAKTAGVIYRAGLGDPNALSDLKTVRPDIANPLARENGDLDAFQEWNLKSRFKENGDIENPWESPAIDVEVSNEINALKENDPSFATLFELQNMAQTGGGVLTRSAGSSPVQALNRFIAGGRSAKFYDLKETKIANVDIYQPTPLHRMYQFFSWPAGERPAGILNLNDPDSSRDIVAAVNRATRTLGGTVDGAIGRNLTEGYLAAATPEARAAQALKIESTIFTSIAAKHGMEPDEALAIYSKYKRARQTAYESLRDKGYAVDLDGTVIKAPLFESQTANFLPMMDFDLADRVLRKYNLVTAANPLLKGVGWTYSAAGDVVDGLDTLQSLFKIGVLARLGFPIRNGVEAQLRIASTAGAMASMRHLPGGIGRLAYNVSINGGKRTIDRLKYITKGVDTKDPAFQVTRLSRQIKELEEQLADTNKIVEGNNLDIDSLAKVQVLDNQIAEKRALVEQFQKDLAKVQTRVEGGKKRLESSVYKYTDLNGEEYELLEAFSGPFGDIYWRNSSAENSMMNLVDNQSALLSSSLIRTKRGTVRPTDANYYAEWARVLNTQFANSQVTQKLISGESLESVQRWLRATPEGKVLRERLSIKPDDIEEHVAQVSQIVNKYIIDTDMSEKIINRVEITPDELAARYSDTSVLPEIHGHVIEENLNRLAVQKVASITNGMMKLIGSMPEDAWARHPLYAELYRRSMEARVQALAKLSGERLTQNQLNLIYKQAHTDALRGTKRTLYTVDRTSNLGSWMRLVSPFFNAFENSVKTWAKIAYDKPQVINRANLIFTAPNRAGIATDENGNPVPANKATMNDYIWIEVPESMKKLPFIGEGLASLNQMGIQKKSLDVIFQGGFNVPVGPYVAIPISEIVKKQPNLEQSLNWAIPYGPERNALTAMLPAWVKRQITKNEGQDSVQYANIYTLIWQTEQHKRKTFGQPAASADEIKKMTDAYWNMRTVANLVLPFAPTFQSPYKFYMDQWKQYKEIYGADADAKYWEAFGDDMYKFTMSLSRNYTGSGATVTDVENAKKYSDLVAQLGDIDPKIIGLVTASGRGPYEFSNAAYQWQQNAKISANSGLTFRGSNDPAQAIKDNNAQLGWIKYRKVMDQIDAVMQARGITNIQSKQAQDIAALKKTMVTQLAQENPDWYVDYKDIDGSKYIKTKQAFQAVLSNQKFMADHGEDPTWKSIAVYLDIREKADAILANRPSKSLSAKANKDIADLLEMTASQLKQDDIAFGDIYDRYFAYDPGFDPALSGEFK